MTLPRRVQRQRTKGWRMPEGVVYVGRPTVYGNPWAVEDARAWRVPEPERRRWVARKYAEDAGRGIFDYVGSERFVTVEEMAESLRGKDLACWCPLDRHCHADVLLALANPDHQCDGEDSWCWPCEWREVVRGASA